MPKIVKNSLSDRRLTAHQRRRLKKLARRPDHKIDTSDIPELTEKFWRNAVRNPFYRPLKQQLTLRLDADIIAWLRLQGRGYQTRANALLRDDMIKNLNPSAGKKRASQQFVPYPADAHPSRKLSQSSLSNWADPHNPSAVPTKPAPAGHSNLNPVKSLKKFHHSEGNFRVTRDPNT